ncbi:hypothetical protein LJY25_05205 [Hymenobacter sp. BT175]|uniref:hypothetical protein n=1 Tax=Hymenobacter translucens TaxID=2886507 RepID=UPI001D0E0E02|nr:hypothetical protein [Hymenobacter translucens]MCC2545832.1 hypothetical protein [Hymenobacter translucens]
MKRLVCFLPALLAGLSSHAQTAPRIPTTGRTVADFIPARYDTLPAGRAVGDLNRDGRPDVALVLRSKAEEASSEDNLPARRLLVLFGTPTGYTLAAQSAKAVLCRECGGIYGDPFAGVTISKGVLSVDHYGGSSWRWSITSKFRYQQGDFYLIGETESSGRNDGDCPGLNGPAGWNYRDANLVTGAYEVKKVSEDCKLLVDKKGRSKPQPLRKLTSYAPVP